MSTQPGIGPPAPSCRLHDPKSNQSPFPHLGDILGGVPKEDVAVAEERELESGARRVVSGL